MSRTLANQNDDLVRRVKPLPQPTLDVGFVLSSRCQWFKVVRILEVEIDSLALAPSLHIAIRPDVVISVEDDICRIAVAHAGILRLACFSARAAALAVSIVVWRLFVGSDLGVSSREE